jgi:uncharacterized membrane protein
MMLLFIHILTTLSSLIIGYYIFLISKRSTVDERFISFFLCAILVVSAVTGILLNLVTFSPFHILSAVTIITIPLALVNFIQAKYERYIRGIFYNFLGLNIAFIGALEPSRYLGYKFWKIGRDLFGFSQVLTQDLFLIMLVGVAVFAIVMFVKALLKPSLIYRKKIDI